MKKIFNKNLILGIIIGILSSSVVVYAASTYLSNQVTFIPSDENWNVSNVEEALNTLYENQNQKISSVGETYTNKYYNGTKNSTNEVNLELEKGTYICSAIYGNAASSSPLNTFTTSGQVMTISNCDIYNELYKYQNYQTGTTYFYDTIFSEVLVGKNFVCTVNNKKSINVSMASGDKNTGVPIGMEFICTKLNIE